MNHLEEKLQQWMDKAENPQGVVHLGILLAGIVDELKRLDLAMPLKAKEGVRK